MPAASPNFSCLEAIDGHLHRLGTQAEQFWRTEPDLALTRCRQLVEAIATKAAHESGGIPPGRESLLDLIRTLNYRGVLSREITRSFHSVRLAGNRAVHEAIATEEEALNILKLTRAISIWLASLLNPEFSAPGDFVEPASAAPSTEPLPAEAAALDAEHDSFLHQVQSAPAPSPAQTARFEQVAAQVNPRFLSQLDEVATRHLIDAQLRDAGWEADTVTLRYSAGTRPQPGRNLAIAEWPTASGPVDYALFAGVELIGVAEAKRYSVDLPSVLGQARRYAQDIQPGDGQFPGGSPWDAYRVPFAFAANGRPYLAQIPEKSGIHFHDLRSPASHPVPLSGWPSPEGLKAEMAKNVPAANQNLKASPIDLPGLRPYQVRAIQAVETAIAGGQREMLLAMATGTGKTRTAVSLLYRLVKFKRFRRILFLVDRTELGSQASDAFDHVKLENLQSFGDIYKIDSLGDIRPGPETKVHIATIQGMVKRVLLAGEEAPPPVDQYDCILVDECHRGYNLDRELAEHEIEFRSQEDFLSKYRRVLDYFHAVKIGLTATPALHTREIFGAPTFTYAYREAVTDGFLCDHEPPTRIITNLAAHGIRWEKGEQMVLFDPRTNQIDLSEAPDEVIREVETFNTQVITENFNRAVCGELAKHLDPLEPGKTLVFCATDSHADLFVRLLKDAMDDLHGPQPDHLIQKITGSAMMADSTLIRRYKNEEMPKIAVTVDLLTTGIDVPEITSLVFVRRVKSRILYEQMLGRATRLCENLFGPSRDKEIFRIYDAVDLYASLEEFNTMKPVVTDPTSTIPALVGAMLAAPPGSEAREAFWRELMVRLHRRRRRMKAQSEELATRFDGLTPAGIIEEARQGPESAASLFTNHPQLPAWIHALRAPDMTGAILVSEHDDAVIDVTSGYGNDRRRPEDYLAEFGSWIEANKTTLNALNLVLTAPASLTRSELKKLALVMDDAGFFETHLREAIREVRHEDCAARLIGYIRAQALGDPLIPYEERVDNAVKTVLSRNEFPWTRPQRQWLERIATQIKREVIVDQEALDRGQFQQNGGFARINKFFDGKLGRLLVQLHESIWASAA